MMSYNMIKCIKRLALELGMHVGVITPSDKYDQEGVYMGQSYIISISGERVVELFNKVALPYKRDNTGSTRKHSDSHWSFDVDLSQMMQPYVSFTTDGNQMILLPDNTVVHA